MARRTWRMGGVILVLAVLLGACTETNTDSDRSGEATEAGGGTGGTGSESTVGITPDTIKVAVIWPDIAALIDAGVVPDTGDVAGNVQVFAERVNQEGGVAGRQFEVTVHEFPVPAGATEQRPACVEATDEEQAFIVVFVGGQAEETLLCVSEEHETLALGLTGNTRTSTYQASGGRLFLDDMSSTRLMENWVTAVDDYGLLDDATIGIIRPDFSSHEDIANTLTKALERAGYDVAEDVALPCETLSQTCEQTDVGAQRLQTAGVDTVFSLLGALAYPSVVGAADAIDYDPQWLSSDYEVQVYSTTAALFGDQAEGYDGAIGVSTLLAVDEPEQWAVECNDYYTQTTGESFETLSDAWQAVAAMCLLVDRIVEAADKAEEAGGLNQASFITEFEKIPFEYNGRRGAFASDKHDGADAYQLFEFSADCTCWEPLGGTVGTDEP
jgi:hypothetical protein